GSDASASSSTSPKTRSTEATVDGMIGLASSSVWSGYANAASLPTSLCLGRKTGDVLLQQLSKANADVRQQRRLRQLTKRNPANRHLVGVRPRTDCRRIARRIAGNASEERFHELPNRGGPLPTDCTSSFALLHSLAPAARLPRSSARQR